MVITKLEHYTRYTKNNVSFYAEKVEVQLQWLEGNIRELRRSVETGNIFEQVNLVSAAASVADAAGKLRAAHEALGNLKDLAEVDDV